ncbi:hypothetical protein Mapa_004311 [Marchantia paleacea]|nr:hypothetical protein Mapa_004311 [Marchantia paleacea]
MSTIIFDREFSVLEFVGRGHENRKKLKSGRLHPRDPSSRALLCGRQSVGCCESGRVWSHSSSAASYHWSKVGSSPTHWNSGTVGSVERENCCSSSVSFPRTWEEIHIFGDSGPRMSRMNVSNSCAAEILVVRSCAAVAGAGEGEGDLMGPEQVEDSESEGNLYHPFFSFAVREVGSRPDVSALLLKEEFRNIVAKDGTTTGKNKAFASSKMRFFRSTYINAGPSMQVLNVAGFSRPEYDMPIFCADFFSTASRNIIVLDLNPLFSTSTNTSYKQRYYDELMPLVNKHAEVLPWGDRLTTESLQFFSPLVLWTKAQGQDLSKTLYPAFKDYLLAWLIILDKAQPTVDPLEIARNQEAQHRYLTWRATKDPGRPLLTRLYGEELSERYIEDYLFHGLKTLGTKNFLDYFPEYRTEDDTISKQRSMVGKSFSTRPWDEHGNLRVN